MITHNLLSYTGAFFIVLAVLLFFVSRRRKKAGQRPASDLVNEQVYVGNLAYRVNEKDLTEHFAPFGELQKVKVIRHFESGRSKGYAFVTYYNAKHANKALQAHGKDLQGRAMVVRIAKPKQYKEDY